MRMFLGLSLPFERAPSQFVGEVWSPRKRRMYPNRTTRRR